MPLQLLASLFVVLYLHFVIKSKFNKIQKVSKIRMQVNAIPCVYSAFIHLLSIPLRYYDCERLYFSRVKVDGLKMATTEATRCAQFSGTPSITKQKNLIYIWLLSSIGLSFFVNSCEPQSAPGKSCSDYLRWILCLPHCVKKVTFCFIFRKRMQKQAEFVLRAKVKVFARMLFCRRYSRA